MKKLTKILIAMTVITGILIPSSVSQTDGIQNTTSTGDGIPSITYTIPSYEDTTTETTTVTDTPTDIPTNTQTDIPSNTPDPKPKHTPKDTPTDIQTDTPTDIPTDNETTIPVPTITIPNMTIPTYTIPPDNESDNETSTPTSTTTPTVTSTPTTTPTSTTTSIPTTTLTSIPTSPTPTPTINTTLQCINNAFHNNASSALDQTMKFNTGDLSSTNKTWYVTWYVDDTEVLNESMTSTSYYTNNTPALGAHIVSATAIYGCNNILWDWNWSVTNNPTPPPSRPAGGGGSTGGGGGGSGGAGVTTAEAFSNIEKHETLEKDLISEKPVMFDFSSPTFSIYHVEVTGLVNEADVSLRLEHLKNISTLASRKPAGIIYANENLWLGSRRVELVTLRYRVSNTWLNSNNLDKNDIKLLKYQNGWKKLNTKITNTDNDYTYFQSISNGVGMFAVSLLKNSTQPQFQTELGQQTYPNAPLSDITTTEPTTTEQEKSTEAPGFGLLLTSTSIVAVFIYIIKRKEE